MLHWLLFLFTFTLSFILHAQFNLVMGEAINKDTKPLTIDFVHSVFISVNIHFPNHLFTYLLFWNQQRERERGKEREGGREGEGGRQRGEGGIERERERKGEFYWNFRLEYKCNNVYPMSTWSAMMWTPLKDLPSSTGHFINNFVPPKHFLW